MLTHTYIFDRYSDAKEAVSALEASKISPAFISLVGRGGDDLMSLHAYAPGEQIAPVNPSGLLEALGLMVIPGAGPLAVGGWLAAGIAARGTTGQAVVETLQAAGHSASDAETLAEALHRGASVVAVRANATRSAEVQALLTAAGGVDPEKRGAAYRDNGWTGFDPDAKPYTSEEVFDERMRYRAAA
ncbi:hypothetical protein [Pseudonocardia sp. TMWB2A]|uniref:hypothetical protein n=1 Tax=Pseudonocardia sp. TMWB2A TaxID=687430 RepID=UPI00307D0A4B